MFKIIRDTVLLIELASVLLVKKNEMVAPAEIGI